MPLRTSILAALESAGELTMQELSSRVRQSTGEISATVFALLKEGKISYGSVTMGKRTNFKLV